MTETNTLFQVSVKAVVVEDGKILMIQEDTGKWELPGGRIQGHDGLEQTLIREVQEEIGALISIIDDSPALVYPTLDIEGRPRLMTFFRVRLESRDFVYTDEAAAVKYCDVDEIKKLDIYPQLETFVDQVERFF